MFVKYYSKIAADFTGLGLTPKSSIGNIERYLLLCHSLLIRTHSVLSGFSSSLFVNIYDWTETKHDCKLTLEELQK